MISNNVTDDHNYGAAALRDELAKVRGAENGTRRNTLNSAAFALGQLIGGGVLDRTTVASELHAAARETGLPDREIDATIDAGLRDGIAEPRAPKADPKPQQRRIVATYPYTDAGATCCSRLSASSRRTSASVALMVAAAGHGNSATLSVCCIDSPRSTTPGRTRSCSSSRERRTPTDSPGWA